jgi:hypothetical protein
MLNRPPWGGIYCFEDSGLFPGVQLRNMNSPTALFKRGFTDNGARWASRVQMWMFDLFDLAWGLRNDNEHGADPETQRMIRLAKAERAICRLYRAIDTLPSHDRFPLVTQ